MVTFWLPSGDLLWPFSGLLLDFWLPFGGLLLVKVIYRKSGRLYILVIVCLSSNFCPSVSRSVRGFGDWRMGDLWGSLGLLGDLGNLLVTFWWPFGGLLVSIQCPFGDLLVTFWWPFGGLLVAFRWSLDGLWVAIR